MYKFGDKLPNGATVVHSTNKHVLAHWPKQRINRPNEWIIWTLTDDGNTINGSYTHSLQRAVELWIQITGACI